MTVHVPYSERLGDYDFGPAHPLKPERFTLAFELMRAYGVLGGDPLRSGPGAREVEVSGLDDADLLLIHDPAYVAAVRTVSENGRAAEHHGIGYGDTPPFHHMHEAAARICAATATALRAVVEGDARRTFSVAGGLHHAHRDRAAGFCVYNDPAVAIAVLRRDHPGLRVAYIDIDAHHGDGVEEAFYDDPDVLTISVHESGRYLFPGTGRVVDRGEGDGYGYAINVPLPPLSDDGVYAMIARDIIAPAVRRFRPDAVVAQCGADAHHADPLTHLGLTLPGYRSVVRSLIGLADEVCDGRICCTGGGGYGTYSVVPRAWTVLLAELLGVTLPRDLPEQWRALSSAIAGVEPPTGLLEDAYSPLPAVTERIHIEVAALIQRLTEGSPLLAK